ncbi:MAG TPA: FkbM family methyltransferase [Candidatus Methanofastidiosa archaeon]|nr:FkbM family methyltransferase [Candidatus Methanofastidiosa archaeon]HPR41401.1 FkbM family methyltransferase [Candidatus Methanofastidiosa archaeon]
MSNADFDGLMKHAKDEGTKKALRTIRKDHSNVREKREIVKGDEVLKLKLFGYTFHMARKCANSSIDILSEIFLEDQHQKMAGFRGDDASVVVDVGANEGYYTMKMKQNNPDLTIYAFEPNPMAFKMLERNITENGLKDVVTNNLALSDIDENESFQLVDEITAIGGFRIFGYRPWLDTARIREIMVRSAKLDNVLKGVDKVDILKVDVEGAEYRVFKGAEDVLARTERVVVEYHGEELKRKIKELLEKWGFTFIFDDEKECGDYYFVR